MSEEDLDAVVAIETASFPRPWTRRHFLDEIQSCCAYPLVALDGAGEVVGYLCLRVVLDEAEILDVAVAHAVRGRGVAAVLVRRAFELCREQGAGLVFLEVRVSNAPALALYRRLDFRETARRRSYYENGEDAILMQHTFEE